MLGGFLPVSDGVKVFETSAGMEGRMVETLVRMMEGHAYRELEAARIFGHGLRFAPGLRWLKLLVWHAGEEVRHFEAVARMFHAFTGESVEPRVALLLARKPVAFTQSWFELGMAQFLFDRAGLWQLRQYDECAFLPYREVARRVVAEEAGHQALGERIVVELCRSGQFEDTKHRCFGKWLGEGMRSFGRPGSEGSRYAVAVGLRKDDPGQVMQRFLDDIKPAVRACGLQFPHPWEADFEGAATLDWST